MRTAAAMVLALLAGAPNERQPCQAGETAVVVRTAERALHLCEGGRSARRFAVALGTGGIGKRRQGDGKTPLGWYPLGAPRPSQSYGTFIPVGYPTAAQARLGFTGSAVGIHGPTRGSAFAGPLTVMVDWTAGCIAVASDDEIRAIATWVTHRRRPAVRIE